MAKVTVTICDICRERIATATCPMCGRDLCKPCSKVFTLELGIKFGPSTEIVKQSICDACFKSLEAKYKEIIRDSAMVLQPAMPEILKRYSSQHT
jgi:hypothetical protein